MGNALPEIKEVTGLKKAKVTIHPEYAIGPIDKRLFSGYMEPLGNLVYGGIWNPDHPEADELGLRKDVMKAIQEFGVPAVRLPGGNGHFRLELEGFHRPQGKTEAAFGSGLAAI